MPTVVSRIFLCFLSHVELEAGSFWGDTSQITGKMERTGFLFSLTLMLEQSGALLQKILLSLAFPWRQQNVH